MSDLAVFLFGCLVTSLCLAAVGLLLWGAHQDGVAIETHRTERSPGGGHAAE
jgi:hypothetical protein